jgi:hypothetical protein
MANHPYANFVLQNEVEDQFQSHIDHARFCTVDNQLEGEPGMIKKIRKYYAKVTPVAGGSSVTGGQAVEKVSLKAGNTKIIEMDYGETPYTVATAQNQGVWYDEEQKADPYVGLVIARYAATDMFNTMNADVIAQLDTTTQTIQVSGTAWFDAFADAQAMLPVTDESEDVSETFALVNKKMVAKLRKALKDDLKYVEAFARRGYVGTVAGTNIFVDPLAPYTPADASTSTAEAGTIYLATKKAVTLFNKTGTEVESYQIGNRSSADADIRKNTLITRKYYIAALTDERYAVKITL